MYVQVLDVNDNAPEFPKNYETFVCENAVSGQVSMKKLATIFLTTMKFQSEMCSIDSFSSVSTDCIFSISKISSVGICIV